MFYREAGQFKTTYESDQAILPIVQDRWFVIAVIAFAYLVVPFLVLYGALRAYVPRDLPWLVALVLVLPGLLQFADGPGIRALVPGGVALRGDARLGGAPEAMCGRRSPAPSSAAPSRCSPARG